MNWRKLEQHEQGMWCATEACWGVPTWDIEVAGVGSKYCSECRAKIEAQAASPAFDPKQYVRQFPV